MIPAAQSVSGMRQVISSLTPADSGKFFDYDGNMLCLGKSVQIIQSSSMVSSANKRQSRIFSKADVRRLSYDFC
jgi:hypothetical protein